MTLTSSVSQKRACPLCHRPSRPSSTVTFLPSLSFSFSESQSLPIDQATAPAPTAKTPRVARPRFLRFRSMDDSGRLPAVERAPVRSWGDAGTSVASRYCETSEAEAVRLVFDAVGTGASAAAEEGGEAGVSRGIWVLTAMGAAPVAGLLASAAPAGMAAGIASGLTGAAGADSAAGRDPDRFVVSCDGSGDAAAVAAAACPFLLFLPLPDEGGGGGGIG